VQSFLAVTAIIHKLAGVATDTMAATIITKDFEPNWLIDQVAVAGASFVLTGTITAEASTVNIAIMASAAVTSIAAVGAFVAIKNVLKEEGKLLVELDWIGVGWKASIGFILQLEAFVECFINKLLTFLKFLKLLY
jgi:hypothetical protein